MTTSSSTAARSSAPPAVHDGRARSTARRSPRCRARASSAATWRHRDRVIDATGKYVIPGGIDVPHPHGAAVRRHVRLGHVRDRDHGGGLGRHDHDRRLRRAAHRRGVQEAWPRGTPRPAATARSTTGSTRSSAASTTTRSKAMDELIDHEGITSFKLFMAYPGVFYSDDGQILRAMQTASNNGALIMMHAENGTAIDVLVAQAARPRRDRPDLPRADPTVRDWRRRRRTGRSCWPSVAGAPLYIVHMSAPRQAVAAAAGPRRRAGTSSPRPARSTCTSPSRTSSARPASRAPSGSARRRCARGPRATRPTCGRACAPTTSPWCRTDHCPFCMKDQKELGIGDFSKIPNGIGTRRAPDGPASTRAWSTGEISLARWVELCSTTPARMFGLYPRKGVIAPGSDADIVVYDPERAHVASGSRRRTT